MLATKCLGKKQVGWKLLLTVQKSTAVFGIRFTFLSTVLQLQNLRSVIISGYRDEPEFDKDTYVAILYSLWLFVPLRNKGKSVIKSFGSRSALVRLLWKVIDEANQVTKTRLIDVYH